MTHISTQISYKKVPEWVQHEDGELSLSGYPIRIRRLWMFFPLRVESDYHALSLPFSTLEAAKNEALYLAKEIDVFTGNQDCFGSFQETEVRAALRGIGTKTSQQDRRAG